MPILFSTCPGVATIYSEILARFSAVRDRSALAQVQLLFILDESGIWPIMYTCMVVTCTGASLIELLMC